MLKKRQPKGKSITINIKKMANWAKTSYRIEGSKNDLEQVFNVINDFMTGKQPPIEDGAVKEWEGNILKALGATDEHFKNNYLRGFIQEYELEGNLVCIEAEEAWGATDFRHVLEQLMPNLTIYYIVEEWGCEIYETNDFDGKYFPERFLVDARWNGTNCSEYFETKEQMERYLTKLMEKKVDNKENGSGDNFIYTHKFEYKP